MIDEDKLIEEIENYRGDIFASEIVELIKQMPTVGEWISCSERFPKDGDNRFYMCVVENHEEDPPMYCQYEEEYGFGYWHDIYNPETLGFVDTEFRTNEELGCEKVIAWMQLPKPYRVDQEKKITNADRIRYMTDYDLAEFLRKVKEDYQWVDQGFPDVEDDWIEWLRSE